MVLVAIFKKLLYNKTMIQYLQIIRRHLTTPIFLIILFLSMVLLFLGERQDALFVTGAALVNTLFGMIQEFRATITLRKIELMSKPKVKILNGKKIIEVDYKAVKVGDVLLVEIGDEMPVDGQVLESSGLECDESILTGESRPVRKKAKDVVYASSIVVAGSAKILSTHVGEETKTGQMVKKLKSYTPQLTPLQKMLTKTIQHLTVLSLVMAAIFYTVYSFNNVEFVKIVKTITTAAITVVPEGLLLASTVFLAYGSLKLTQAKVLLQKLSAIESMALIDVLCVDKTGTLTSPEITFDELHWLGEFSLSQKNGFQTALGYLARESKSPNATTEALAREMPSGIGYRVLDELAFSSTKKMSGIKIKRLVGGYNIVLGAPEFVAKIAKLSPDAKQHLNELNAQGLRTLLLASLPMEASFADLDKKTKPQAEPIALVTLKNYLRDGVVETIEYLQSNGITLKVISGDNPATVSFIAKQAGIARFDQTITGEELEKLKGEKWDKTVLATTIFARVLPHQKEKIIATYKKHGFYTGMVGDGVNDALALKQSDLGVAMQAGAAATRRISDIVLLNNSFNSLPMGMELGNRIIQSIEMIACLFFHKIIFGVTLSVLTLLSGLIYPFSPRHLTFMNMFLVTLPTVIFTIFPPLPRQRLNPKNFWKDTLFNIAPLGVLSGIGIYGAYVISLMLAPKGTIGSATVTVLVTTFFGMFAVRIINLIFDTRQSQTAKLATISYVLASTLIALTSFGFKITRDFFNFYQPDFWSTVIGFGFVTFVAVIQYRVAKLKRYARQKAAEADSEQSASDLS